MKNYYQLILVYLFLFLHLDLEIQALLSQDDVATCAEKLLKQFSDGIKDEPNTDSTAFKSTSPKNMAADSTTTSALTTDSIKCEVTSTSTKSIGGKPKLQPRCEIKNEAAVKIEKLFKPNKNFSITMDSKQIIEGVK